MARIASFEIFAVDLPFRRPFRHAAAERNSSDSLFLRCTTDTGTRGHGSCLPREYVTGETRDGALAVLRDRILPRLVGSTFDSQEDVERFLRESDGKPPAGWADEGSPHAAAWCAVDLALLDAFGHEFDRPVLDSIERDLPSGLCYSGVLSAHRGWPLVRTALKMRLYGLRSIKLKVERDTSVEAVRVARRFFGRACDIRVDANMAWSGDEAARAMKGMAELGVRSFEQPLERDDLAGLARLVRETGCDVMADESLTDRESLARLIEQKACTSVNVRISKCGGLIASRARCEEALQAGLAVQLGCQVGESSLLSAAHLALVAAVRKLTYLEGLFGRRLLREDPATPVLQFGYGGRPPARPAGPGLGVAVDEAVLRRHAVRTESVGPRGTPE